MQITCEHKLACSWLELDHNFFLNLEFSTLSLLETPLQKTTAKSKRLGTESSAVNSTEHNWRQCD